MAEFTGILGEIEEIAGRDAAVILSATHGGRSGLYIPKSVTGWDWLSALVGLDAARAIAERFGGDYLSMPAGVGIRARVRQLRSTGWTIYKIAKAVGKTERYVYKVLAEAEAGADDRQADLFA